MKHRLLLVQILWIQVAGILGFCATQRREPGNQEKPVSQDRRRYSISSFLAEAGNVQSRPRFNDNSSHCSCVSTHHIVLECTWVLTHHVVVETPSVKKCTWLLLCCWLPKLHRVMRAELTAELRLSEKKRSPYFPLSFFLYLRSSFHCVKWCRLILCRSVSLHKRTSLVCYENFFSFSYCFYVFLLNSFCSFPRVESIFRDLLLCWSNCCWFGCCFRSHFQSRPQLVWGIRWCHLPIFFLVFRLFCWSCILSWVLGSIPQLWSTISHSVIKRFSSPIHFIFLWVILQHLIFLFSIFSIASLVLGVNYNNFGAAMKNHDFIRLSDINFGQCTSSKNTTSNKMSRLQTNI